MDNYMCLTCGTQFAATVEASAHCPICEDERQYVGWDGQRWTTTEELATRHAPRLERELDELMGVGLKPAFAIGQRALLVPVPGGNVLWDCVPLLDTAMAARIEALGGLVAIAISHPHYYTTMVDWARHFDVPVYLHAADRAWVQRRDAHLRFWDGDELTIEGDLRLVRLGGHFAGGQVLHWPAGAAGKGALLSGDIVQVVQDRRWVSFMYSYPNLVPLPAATIGEMVARLEPHPFDRIYGAWWGRIVATDGKGALRRSAERYLRALESPLAEQRLAPRE